MFSKLFLSEKDLEAIQRALTRNPLLASLLMISPIEAFKYLNLMPRLSEGIGVKEWKASFGGFVGSPGALDQYFHGCTPSTKPELPA